MSDTREYVIRQTARGYEIDGPALSAPSVFENEAKCVALARYLIAAKSGGGHIVHPNGMRDFYQGSKSLTNDGALQR